MGILDVGTHGCDRKVNQLSQRAADKSPQQLWFDEETPNLSNMFILGQLACVPVMNKTERRIKQKNTGGLVCYLGRDQP